MSMTFSVSICVKNFALQIFLFNKTAQIFNKISFMNFKIFSTVWKKFCNSLNCSIISFYAMIYLFIIILISASDLIIMLLIRYFIEIRLIASNWVLEFKSSTRLKKYRVELKFFEKVLSQIEKLNSSTWVKLRSLTR